jgi:hypothetical protein
MKSVMNYAHGHRINMLMERFCCLLLWRLRFWGRRAMSLLRLTPGALLKTSEDDSFAIDEEACRKQVWTRFENFFASRISCTEYLCVNMNIKARLQSGPKYAFSQK